MGGLLENHGLVERLKQGTSAWGSNISGADGRNLLLWSLMGTCALGKEQGAGKELA